MPSDVAVSVRNLTKTYRIFDGPGDRVMQALSFGRRQLHTGFTALHDVSFDIRKGEAVGIIGRNGSGKSTLLQLICGILKPTSGSVQVDGRISALLELGSGFNPEFTGRENVYFQGAVTGFSKARMDQRIDDIIAFADIGAFIDQPVRTYSSGMFVRLAFAVIAHADADILVIDEALAVGDAVFTQKCMRFLRSFMTRGTVLFVSHDTGSVQSLCSNAIWLNKGAVAQAGIAKKVVEAYVQSTHQEVYGDKIQLRSIGSEEREGFQHPVSPAARAVGDSATAGAETAQLSASSGWESGKARLLSVRLLGEQGQDVPVLSGGELVNLEIVATANENMFSPILGWFVKDRLGQSLFGEHTFNYVNPPLYVKAGEKFKASFVFKVPLLPNGEYAVTVSVAEGEPFEHVQHHWLHDALILKVASDQLRYGLVGIPFREVKLSVIE